MPRPLAPNGLTARIVLGFVGTAGSLYANIGPVIVSGLAATEGFTDETAGYVLSLDLYGAMAGGLAIIPFVARSDWRPVAAALLAFVLGADLASLQANEALALYGLRFLHGLGSGGLLGLGLSVIGRTPNPEKTIAFCIGIQITLGGFGALMLTPLIERDGIGVVWLSLAAYGAITIGLLPWLDRYPAVQRSGPDVRERHAPWLLFAAACAALFLYQSGQMAAFAYMIEFGHHAGLEDAFISFAIAVSLWSGGPAAVLAAWWSTRSGRLRPASLGMLLTAAAIALVAVPDAGAYFAANVGFGVLFSLSFPYLLGIASEMDNTGRFAAIAGFVSAAGLASGPAIAAALLADGDYPMVLACSVGALLASAALVVAPARLLDRRNFRGRVEW